MRSGFRFLFVIIFTAVWVTVGVEMSGEVNPLSDGLEVSCSLGPRLRPTNSEVRLSDCTGGRRDLEPLPVGNVV